MPAAARELLACRACKKQKRRCDKAIPECSLCRRTRRTCEYEPSEVPEQEQPPSAAVIAALRTRLGELEQRLDAQTHPYTHPYTTPIDIFASDGDGGGEAPVAVAAAAAAAPRRASSYDVDIEIDIDVEKGPRISGSSTVASIPDQHEQENPEFPAVLFLDIDCFIWSGLQLPDPSVGIPRDVLALLSQGNVVVETSTAYFATIHTWMPIVSKKRMELGHPVRNGGPAIAMLFVAMKLITAPAAHVADGTLYSIAKGFLSSLEGSGVVSLLCLQAMVLVALYEYGHAIYPAAWMTVGACARYAEMLKLSCGEMDMSFTRKVESWLSIRNQSTWTEVEERRRVWWAIFILDRLVSMGSRRSCSVAEPPSDGKLPVDDDAWDTGDVTRALGHIVSTDYRVHQTSYARLCQAAIYIGRTGVCANSSQQPMSSLRITEITSLAQELDGFSAVMDSASGISNSNSTSDNFIRLLAPRCLVYSALFIVLDAFICPVKLLSETGFMVSSGAKSQQELDLQASSMQAVLQASTQAHNLAMELSARIELDGSLRRHLGKVSPFMLHLMYSSMATSYWLLGENGDEASRSSLADVKSLMETLGVRWGLCRKYVEIAGFHDREGEE